MNIQKIKQEQVVFLRNNDVFTISQRGVTTDADTGTFSNDGSHTISVVGVKNVRSVVIGGDTKAVGSDYTVAYGISTSVITFIANQSGAYTITYDYGSDKIYPDFPRDDLTINSFPRIALDVLNVSMDALGIGGDSFISNVALTIVVYDDSSTDLDNYVNTIKELYVSNSKNFYYLKFIKPTFIGPTINSPDKKDEIMQKNIDILGMFEVDQA